MPVHAPGPQLYKSVPFKYLAQKGAGAHQSSDVHVNITPFVDMMTILVTFLLMVFSATGDILMSQKGLDLPDAASKKELRKAPVIAITRDAITFNSGGGGEMMADPSTIDNDSSPQWKIVELFERLKAERKAFDIAWRNKAADDPEKQRCANPNEPKSAADICIVGLLILQADKRTSAKVINRVLKTANAAGYTNLMFAVNRVSSRGG